MKLAKLDHIFITHRSWENLGGLLGLSLTIQDIGVPEITLHGPPGIDLLYDATEKFVLTRDLKIVKRNHNEKPYSDSCMEIQYIPIYKPSNSQEMLSSSSESDSSDGHEKFRKLKSSEVSSDSDLNEFESPSRKPKKLRLSRYKAYSDMTMAYVCKGHSKPGHLLIHKCVEEGVPPGPLLGELKNGKDVILPSGRTIYSKDVVSPEELCPLFLVVECPSEEFLDPFVGEEKFRCYQSNDSESSETAALVVHFTPPHVLKCLKYQQWMKR
ncbi:zinc phosphodiesterase ELAC protein 2-like [Stegodyphus dumicola]|uniref:zinc phosphodiesterase ELAC protein 2-like n=1 Tax=Stegodyphus dumicola TaxID=202533 RepID=UPI0015B1542E|nr:zinc phosphodiesterase ELAC protein 2-like [Stegodyphus dumicola]